MQEHSWEQCEKWKRRCGIRADPFGRPRALSRRTELSFTLPEGDQDGTALADVIAGRFRGQETLVHLLEWPMFTRSEMRDFQAWRERHGCPSRLMDAPGFVFTEGLDNEAGRALLAFALTYGWEGQVLPASGDAFLWIMPYSAKVVTARSGEARAWIEALAAVGLAAEPA